MHLLQKLHAKRNLGFRLIVLFSVLMWGFDETRLKYGYDIVGVAGMLCQNILKLTKQGLKFESGAETQYQQLCI